MATGQKKNKRKIDRTPHRVNGVIVVCDTQEQLYVDVVDISPLGVGAYAEADSPDILGKDVIIVTETMIMYADVARQEKQEGARCKIGLSARKFSEEVLQYLFDSVTVKKEN